MIVEKTNRDGIDVVIHDLQGVLFNNLPTYLDGSATYECYPRANKNFKQGDDGENLIPEISLDEKDYKEVLTDDTFSVTSFFLPSDSSTYQDEWGQIKQEISVIFQVNLVEAYASTERYDEQFDMDVLRVLKKENKYIVDDIEREIGYNNVFSDLTLTGVLEDSIKKTDLSEFHVVKFTFNVIYKPKCNR